MTKGGFWTNPETLKYDPKAQFRFRVEVEGLGLEDAPGSTGAGAEGDYANDNWKGDTSVVWYAKSIEKPKLAVADRMGPEGFRGLTDDDRDALYLPNIDRPVWKDISMKLIDVGYPTSTRKLLRWFRRSGYNDNLMKSKLDNAGVSSTEALFNSIGKVTIIQLGSHTKFTGAPPNMKKEALELERWTLIRPFPVEIDFGSLDYSSDEFVEISILWRYATCMVDFINYPLGQEFEEKFRYFRDPGQRNKNHWFFPSQANPAPPKPEPEPDDSSPTEEEAELEEREVLEGSDEEKREKGSDSTII